MRSFYVFVSRDALGLNDKRLLTYKRIDEPSWIARAFGKRIRSKIVKFVGKDYNWVSYPDSKPCSNEQIEMLHMDNARYESDDPDVYTF